MLRIKKHLLFLYLITSIFYTLIKSEKEALFEHSIDIVYLWVDGNDPEWKETKNYHASFLKSSQKNIADEVNDNRFADHEELRYSLRSIWMYAPFINHIYIVTMNQRPKWLLDHPKITLVDHKEIFKNPNDLPTFNSQAIESNLHRIPNLSEHFIYFNDDVFLGTPVSPFNFFCLGDKVKVLFEKSLSPSGPLLESELSNPNSNTSYRKAWRNTNAFLDKLYKSERRRRLRHAPFALRKSFIEQAEREFPFVFESNSSHKFRSDEDYNITNGLLQYYWHYNNKITKGNMTNMMVSLRDDNYIDNNKKDFENIKKLKINCFCLQDVMGENSEETKKLLSEFLNAYYPQPAPWEK